MLLEWIRETGNQEDLTTKAVVQRLRQTARYVDGALSRSLAAARVDLWEFEALTSLLRARPDSSLTMGQLAHGARLTSGAITNRIGRLEERGLVVREIAPADRRQIRVTLTAAGRARCEEVIEHNNAAEHALFDAVDPRLLRRVADDLRALLAALEASEG